MTKWIFAITFAFTLAACSQRTASTSDADQARANSLMNDVVIGIKTIRAMGSPDMNWSDEQIDIYEKTAALLKSKGDELVDMDAKGKINLDAMDPRGIVKKAIPAFTKLSAIILSAIREQRAKSTNIDFSKHQDEYRHLLQEADLTSTTSI